MILDTDIERQKRIMNTINAIESLRVDLKYALKELMLRNSLSVNPLLILKFTFFTRSFDDNHKECWSIVVDVRNPNIYETTLEKLEKLIEEKQVFISFN